MLKVDYIEQKKEITQEERLKFMMKYLAVQELVNERLLSRGYNIWYWVFNLPENVCEAIFNTSEDVEEILMHDLHKIAQSIVPDNQ